MKNSSSGEVKDGSSEMSTASSVTTSSVSFALDPLEQPQCPFSSISAASQSWYGYDRASSQGSPSSSVNSGDINRDEKLQQLGQAKMLARAVSSESLRKLAQEHKEKKAKDKTTAMNGGKRGGDSRYAKTRRTISADLTLTKPVSFKMIPEHGRRWSAPDDIDDDDDWGVGTGWGGQGGQSSMYCPYTPGDSPEYTPKAKAKKKKKDRRSSSKSTAVINPAYQFGLSSSRVRSVFPYHVVRILC